jgi:formate dehydrogenase
MRDSTHAAEADGSKEVATFCRICEPLCGLVARVEDGRLVGVRGDKQNPHSQGFQCVKSVGMVDIVYDPERVLTPLRRNGPPGSFEPVSWDEALADIAAKLKSIVRRHGPRAVAAFLGNPPGFNYSPYIFLHGFMEAIGSPWKFSINGEDAASRCAATALLYGTPTYWLKPDVWRTQFALITGANPYVAQGSMMSEPRIREALEGIPQRGGRVVVVDPRRSETARRFEHIPIRAGTDPYFLAALLNVLTAEGLVEHAFLEAHTVGYDRLVELVRAFTPEAVEERCGIPSGDIRELARSLAAAPSAYVCGRTGTCTQRFGTLNNLLQDLIVVVTGNLDKPGGLLFPWGPIDFTRFAELVGWATYGKVRTRVKGLPDVMGLLPSQGFAADVLTPGEGQIRALLSFGSNWAHSSSAAGPDAQEALRALDLHFSIDLYVNETNRFADYILPSPTFFEREDLPLTFLGDMIRPAIFATDAVIERIGDTREEWEILNDIARRMGLGGAYALAPLRWLARLGLCLHPRTMVDALLRVSNVGDWFGLRRSGLSWRKLVTDHAHGKSLRAELPSGVLKQKLRTADKKINLALPELEGELVRLRSHVDDERFPLRVHQMRELRSMNTWMHNAARLMPASRTYAALVNPRDIEPLGLTDGDEVTVVSTAGEITVPIRITDDVHPGNIALPHGWGHCGGWERANAAGGANVNLLVSTDIDDVERLAAMSILNGIPVRLKRPDKVADLEGSSPSQ